jgi:hypothetical protein
MRGEAGVRTGALQFSSSRFGSATHNGIVDHPSRSDVFHGYPDGLEHRCRRTLRDFPSRKEFSCLGSALRADGSSKTSLSSWVRPRCYAGTVAVGRPIGAGVRDAEGTRVAVLLRRSYGLSSAVWPERTNCGDSEGSKANWRGSGSKSLAEPSPSTCNDPRIEGHHRAGGYS